MLRRKELDHWFCTALPEAHTQMHLGTRLVIQAIETSLVLDDKNHVPQRKGFTAK